MDDAALGTPGVLGSKVIAVATQAIDVAKRLYYDSAALDFTATVTDIRLDSRAGK